MDDDGTPNSDDEYNEPCSSTRHYSARYTDVTQLGRAINEKLNKLQSTTNKTYMHVKSQNIFINTEERQANWDKPLEHIRAHQRAMS